MGRHYSSKIEKVLDNIIVNDKNNCWEWTGGKNKCGYGVSCFGGKRILAHRLSYLAFCGEIPINLLVCHRCDNTSCVNPEHLFVGTAKDNMNDRDKKGRQARPRGEKQGAHKLTTEQVLEIRNIEGKTLHEIGKIYGVSYAQIWLIRNRKEWTHI